MTAGKAAINVSLDCGTRETFRKIKGVDAFERVVQNLISYSVSASKAIDLKYIFLPGINDNMSDVDGFIDIVGKCNARTVVISSDYTVVDDSTYDGSKSPTLMKYLHKKSVENGVNIHFETAYAKRIFGIKENNA